ncbi:MAG: hypothetical protein JWM99_671 [Verrucomicrobiales bacterium]|nr:hypothetical protein [Verrucomicrobiales bacterium]
MKKLLRGTLTLLLLANSEIGRSEAAAISWAHTNYHGWADAWVCGNGIVEAVVVPAIGRIMQFRFAENQTGPFWENQNLNGKLPDPKSSDWGNFGGDKSWPSPQADWPKLTPRGWPPPVAFDSMPVAAKLDEGALILTSAIDPDYGVRTVRRVSLRSNESVMQIKTTYEKVSGSTIKCGIWIITQLKDPAEVFIPIPLTSPFKEGYIKQSDLLPARLNMKDHLLGLRRDTKNRTKIGTTADMLIWVGEKEGVKIESRRAADSEYPDEGSSAEVYTNPDENAYVELELLGPLRSLETGTKIEQTSTYTLYHRPPGKSTVDFGRDIATGR